MFIIRFFCFSAIQLATFWVLWPTIIHHFRDIHNIIENICFLSNILTGVCSAIAVSYSNSHRYTRTAHMHEIDKTESLRTPPPMDVNEMKCVDPPSGCRKTVVSLASHKCLLMYTTRYNVFFFASFHCVANWLVSGGGVSNNALCHSTVEMRKKNQQQQQQKIGWIHESRHAKIYSHDMKMVYFGN